MQKVVVGTNGLLSLIRHGSHGKRRCQQSFCYCIRTRYRSKLLTEPLPRKNKGTFTESLQATIGGYTYRQILMAGIYEVHFEMGSDAMMNIPCFINICFGIQWLIFGVHRRTAWISLKPIL
jgi:hypothetical protein